MATGILIERGTQNSEGGNEMANIERPNPMHEVMYPPHRLE
jgi:hypothetical protein